jgi:hypothetical protein
MSKKMQTNEQKLMQLVKSNDSLLNALLNERILLIMELTENEIKKAHEKGEKFSYFVDDDYYLKLCNNVRDILATK